MPVRLVRFTSRPNLEGKASHLASPSFSLPEAEPDRVLMPPPAARNPRPLPARLSRLPVCLSIALLLLCLAAWAPLIRAQADGPHADTIAATVDYLRQQVTPEGGLDAFGSGADPSTTARAIIALGTAGIDPVVLSHPESGLAPLDYLVSTLVTYTHESPFEDSEHLFPGNAGLALAALASADLRPAPSTGVDLVEQLEATLRPTGAYSTTAASGFTTGEALASNQAWAMLGLAMAGRPVPATAASYLIGLQEPSGGWQDSDPDTTGLAVVALMSTGHVAPTDPAISRARDMLWSTQLSGGGWRPAWDTEPINVDSTAWAIQAMLACGHQLPLASHRTTLAADEALSAAQLPNGSLGGEFASAYSTAEGILGLSGVPFYLTPALRVERGLAWLAEQVSPDLAVSAAVDIASALAFSGYDPRSLDKSGVGLMHVIEAQAQDYAAASVDQAGKVAVLLGQLEPAMASMNAAVAAAIDAAWDPAVQAFGTITNTYHQAYAILGLHALGEPVPDGAATTLLSLQQADGGWKYDLAEAEWNTTTPDNTGLAIQALIAAGLDSAHPAIQGALGYLRSTQDSEGGWSNANATAMALQGLRSAGEEPGLWRTQAGYAPVFAIARYGKADGPAVWMWDSPWGGPEDSLLATVQYIPALDQRTLLSPPVPLAPYNPMPRGADPDILLPSTVRFWGRDGTLQVRLGAVGDSDGDASATIAWLRPDMSTWSETVVLAREADVFAADIPVDRGWCMVRITLLDPDGVRSGENTGQTVTLTSRVPVEAWLGGSPVPIPARWVHRAWHRRAVEAP
ncbi:MAG: hypothetical protein GXX94_01465 [Chloroflexi bacterium]|nr:hypothetical protein [Chloroflexota bacterium]